MEGVDEASPEGGRSSNVAVEAVVGLAVLFLVPGDVVGATLPAQVGPFEQQVAVRYSVAEGLPSPDVRRIVLTPAGTVLAETAAGWAALEGEGWRRTPPPDVSSPEPIAVPQARARAASPSGAEAVASSDGLFYRRAPGEEWQRLRPSDGRRSWAPRDVRDVAFDERGGLWFASPQGVGHCPAPCRAWSLYSTEDGLPYDDLTAIAAGARGDVWIGTRIGAIRYDADEWEYRQGRRWLPGDDVRDVAVAVDGTAWFATDGGVGRIEGRPTTLAEKAARFEADIDRYHRRTPYGYVDSVRLTRPGDRSEFEQRDSDNDGLWTGMYGAGQAFAYAATGSPAARRRARRAFEALRFLSEVTQGGDPPGLPGLIARSILPTSGPDPNTGLLERDRRLRREQDRLWKVLSPRWPTSADGRWYWKSDASSDELDGHFFFYARYYDLVAATEAERDEVREVVTRIVDHLIDNDFSLVDHDGRPTRWAVFGPAQLNHDPDWWQERGLNSLSLLSYLRVAEWVSGNERYGTVARRLIEEHAYAANAGVPKIHLGPGTGNQSDDEMAFMCFYNLLLYEKDPELRQILAEAFHRYWQLEAPERNPLFHFLYAAHGVGRTVEETFGTRRLDPTGDWLEDSLDTLRRYPLDRVSWALRNSHRKDLVRLRGSPTRGTRRDGKVLPIDERFVDKWNHDPWRLDFPGDGRTLADGASFLLPYYLGLYHGFLEEAPRDAAQSRKRNE
jgi:hypothetical protein